MSDGVSGSVSVQVQRSVSQKAEQEPFLPVSSTSNKKLTATLRDRMELTPINTNVTDTPSSFYVGNPVPVHFLFIPQESKAAFTANTAPPGECTISNC